MLLDWWSNVDGITCLRRSTSLAKALLVLELYDDASVAKSDGLIMDWLPSLTVVQSNRYNGWKLRAKRVTCLGTSDDVESGRNIIVMGTRMRR